MEFSVRRTRTTRERPHGISYAIVLRPAKGGRPLLRFDNAHSVSHRGGKHGRPPVAHDHWHRAESDPGGPYGFTTAAQLLDDFWREVKRVLDERGIPNDL